VENEKVVIDDADESRMGTSRPVVMSCRTVVNIDHHPTNPGYGTLNLVDPNSSSTAELVFKVLREMHADISLDVATNLYTGLLTDTGSFRYSNTAPSSLEMAASLLELGVNASDIAEAVFERKSYAFLRLLGSFLEKMCIDKSGTLAWSVLDNSTISSFGVNDAELEGLSSYIKMVKGVEVGIIFREQPDGSTKLSFRSRKRVDVSALAGKLGGGGHKRAAGATITNNSLDETVDKVLVQL
jgi:phosphoesterase RecJ-like protein